MTLFPQNFYHETSHIALVALRKSSNIVRQNYYNINLAPFCCLSFSSWNTEYLPKRVSLNSAFCIVGGYKVWQNGSTLLTNIIVQLYCPAILSGFIIQKYCLAIFSGVIVQLNCPATLSGNIIRQYCPAILFSNIVQQYCLAILSSNIVWQYCP